VKAIGWGVSANYQIGRGFEFMANVSGDRLRDVPANLVTFFNTPRIKYNIGLMNSNVRKGIGFNVNYRWQDDVYWEGTFGTGDVPAYGTLDGQVNYKPAGSKSIFKIGGSNLGNNYYRSAFGNPRIGGIYYISYGFNL
jgi:hypothetical protein